MATYIVSGLARSGTSMMMRAISVAGVPAFHDEFRKADGRNPDGYFEHSAVFTGQPWEAEGRCVKVLFPHLDALPPGDYRVVCMTRNLGDVRESMRLPLPVSYLADMLAAGRETLDSRDDCEVLYVDYDDVVLRDGMSAVADFLGLDVDRMLSVVRSK